MNRYSYKQSIRDGATNAVKFEPRLAELRVDRVAIDDAFEKIAEDNELDEEEKTALSKRAGKLAIMLKAPKRMAAISEDIAHHFNSHVKPKNMKGLVVVYDRDACVQMYYLLGKKLGFDAVEIVMNVDQAPIKEQGGAKMVNKIKIGLNGVEILIYQFEKQILNVGKHQIVAQEKFKRPCW